MKKVRINKENSDSFMWYNNYVGEEFTYIRTTENYYLVKDNEGFTNIVNKSDGTLIK